MSAPASALFVSDVHLGPERPERVAAFLEFLARAAPAAGALYLLGDLFDEWLGDDDDRAPHPAVEHALAGVTAAGVPVMVMHGNHDFLIGERFAARTGCRLIPDPTVVDLSGRAVLLAHGDALCTRDAEYQAHRREVRDPGRQREFLARSLAARAEYAAVLRHRSRARSRLKPEEIMDVTPEAVADAMRAHGVATLVHGHTHRPAVHRFDLDARDATRIVLGDWYEEERVLEWHAGAGFRLVATRDLAGAG